MLAQVFIPLLLLVGVAVASPATPSGGHPKRCTEVRLRREWRDLKVGDKHAYIRAVQCLQTSPAKDKALDKKITRYEEFVASHTIVSDGVHGVGHFLPWHRQFGFLYETALREECGYRGPFPFWDWTRDAAGNKPLRESPIFDPITGFGPDGTPGTFTMLPDLDGPPPGTDLSAPPPELPPWGCVTSGPFANLTLHLGPGRRTNTDHCLTRSVTELQREHLMPKEINAILDQKVYVEFWNALDGRPYKPVWRLHDSGHLTVGGDMTNVYTSPNDPLFYLHHAGLDRLWWKWQHAKPGIRLSEIGGRSSPVPPYGQVTLDFPLQFGGLAPAVPVGKVMNTAYEPYCYAYS